MYYIILNRTEHLIRMKFSSEIIERFFGGRYSRADYMVAKSLFTDIELNDDLVKHLEDHWSEFNTEPLPDVDTNPMLERVHRQILHETIPGRSNNLLSLFQKAAAILIIPLLLGFLSVFYFQSDKKPGEAAIAEIQCPLGVRTKFVLPDGTTGFLNSSSTLEYPVVFGNERKVTLMGEAYFDVRHDEERPFVVKTAHLNTKVMGTQFNVIAYENENTEEIILREGEVEVYSRKGQRLGTLESDQKLEFDRDNRRYGISQVESAQYISWTEGKLVFRNESMEDVARRLGRWYNVDIDIQDPELFDYSFRATFMDEPLEEVLKLLSLTAPMSFKEQQRVSTNQNLFKKRKVILRIDSERVNAF